MAKTKKSRECSMFEEMLMWTSYRYCIGRHTYVTTMAWEIGKHYYDLLSPDRREFTANDIRNEIFDQLRFHSFNFGYEGIYGDERNPLPDFLDFMEEYGVKSADELMTYKEIHRIKDYNDGNTPKWEVAKVERPVISSHYFSKSEIDDLLPWMELAEYFDTKNHKLLCYISADGKYIEEECYMSYTPKLEPVPDKPGYYHQLPWGWEKCWKSVKDFGEYSGCIAESELADRGVIVKNIE